MVILDARIVIIHSVSIRRFAFIFSPWKQNDCDFDVVHFSFGEKNVRHETRYLARHTRLRVPCETDI